MLPADDTTALDIEDMVFDALDRLPEPFAISSAASRSSIEDEATPEQLASVGACGLYGLYQGIPRTRFRPRRPQRRARSRSSAARSSAPAGRGALAAAVADTVYHEIAHHFGISDARLGELRSAPTRRRGSARPAAEPGGGGGRPTSPSRWAIAPASARFDAPSLSKMFEAWTLAVLRLMYRASAICWLDQPPAMRRRTSRSRSVSPRSAPASSRRPAS